MQLGTPGVKAAEPVSFIPGDFFTPGVALRTPIFTEEQMAQAITNAIAAAMAKGLLSSDVVATKTDGEVLVDGVRTITGVVSVLRSNIRDIAGNPLKPNRSDGTTSFTVFVGSGLDYGDAPSSYGTLDSENGLATKSWATSSLAAVSTSISMANRRPMPPATMPTAWTMKMALWSPRC